MKTKEKENPVKTLIAEDDFSSRLFLSLCDAYTAKPIAQATLLDTLRNLKLIE